MDKTIGPASRTLRFLAFALGIAGLILWAVRGFDGRPWIALRFCGLDLRALLWHHEFYFGGGWRVPGWWRFTQAYQYVAGSWLASISVGAALFVGGIGARWLDRLIVRWNRTPTVPLS